MDRRSFLGRSFLGLCAAVITPTVLVQKQQLNSIVIPRLEHLPPYNLYVSRELLEDIKNWGVDQIDSQTKREIYENTNCGISHRVDSVSFIVTDGNSKRAANI